MQISIQTQIIICWIRYYDFRGFIPWFFNWRNGPSCIVIINFVIPNEIFLGYQRLQIKQILLFTVQFNHLHVFLSKILPYLLHKLSLEYLPTLPYLPTYHITNTQS